MTNFRLLVKSFNLISNFPILVAMETSCQQNQSACFLRFSSIFALISIAFAPWSDGKCFSIFTETIHGRQWLIQCRNYASCKCQQNPRANTQKRLVQHFNNAPSDSFFKTNIVCYFSMRISWAPHTKRCNYRKSMLSSDKWIIISVHCLKITFQWHHHFVVDSHRSSVDSIFSLSIKLWLCLGIENIQHVFYLAFSKFKFCLYHPV